MNLYKITDTNILCFLHSGNLAVLSFFLFSGFLIGYNCIIEHAGNYSYLQFSAVKRVVHIIVPCAVVSMFGWIIQRWGLVYNVMAHDLGADDYVISVFVTPPVGKI